MKKFENLAKAFYDIGKYSFTALVVGQFLSERFNPLSMAVGIVFTSLAFVTAIKLEKIKEEE